jgi:hypothetical protein
VAVVPLLARIVYARAASRILQCAYGRPLLSEDPPTLTLWAVSPHSAVRQTANMTKTVVRIVVVAEPGVYRLLSQAD